MECDAVEIDFQMPKDGVLATHDPIRASVAYGFDGRRIGDIPLADISEVLERPDTFVWLGLHEPDERVLDVLQEEFGLHDLAVEDAHHAHQRPKVELYGDTLFIVVRTAQEIDGDVRFGETHVFLGRRFLVTIRHGASLSYAPARARCEREPELLALGPSYCLYAVLDAIVDHYAPIVAAFREELDRLETWIFEAEFRRPTIERLYALKKSLVTVRFAIDPIQDILSELAQRHPNLIHERVRPYLRDVFDHAVRIKQSCDTLSEMLTAAMNVNMAMVSVGQNEAVKKLAGWAAIVAIPTLIASIYGMNFEHMPELGWLLGYPLALTLMGGIAGWLYVKLKRSNWL